MSFEADCRQVGPTLEAQILALLEGTSIAAFDSIVNGSAATGAPGQPVDKGDLKDSWERSSPTPTSRLIASDNGHAVAVEENYGGHAYHSGGSHSVAATYTSAERLAEQELRKMGTNA